MLLRFPASFWYYLIMSFRYGLYLFYVCFKDSFKAMSSSLTGYALVTACRAEVTIYMKENNLKGYYILTGMAKV